MKTKNPSRPQTLTIVKKSEIGFFFYELIRYFGTWLTIFAVALFTSNGFTSGHDFIDFVAGKFNAGSSKEFYLTISACIGVASLAALAQHRAEGPEWANDFIDDLLNEIPRFFYLFGATLSVCCLGLYFLQKGTADGSRYLTMAVQNFVLVFIGGYIISRFVNGKYIRSRAKADY